MSEPNGKDISEEIGLGTMCISTDSTRRSPSVIVKSTGINIVSMNPAIGITVDDSGIMIQGSTAFSASGKHIIKGPYTENDKSYKPYTYAETIQPEAMAKEAIYNMMGQAGIDVSTLRDIGSFPLMTSIGGYPPHNHTMMTKHVHKLEPTYLYRISPKITGLKTTLEHFKQFLAK
jgi:hypothetical protein